MNRNDSVRTLLGFAICAIAYLGAAPALAQLNRTAVSSGGNDANSCALGAPCRTFSRAMSQTNDSGEILVLDSAGYGAFTINRSVAESKSSFVKPSSRPFAMARPDAAHGKTAFR